MEFLIVLFEKEKISLSLIFNLSAFDEKIL